MDRYIKMEQIGSGTYGTVFKAKDEANDLIVALKEIQLNSMDDEGVPSTALREIALLKDMQSTNEPHPNVVKLIDVLHEVNSLTLVFEYVAKDLKKYIEEIRSSFKHHLAHSLQNKRKLAPRMSDLEGSVDSLRGPRMHLKEVKSFTMQLLKAIAHCHRNGVLHRDIKPQNILIGSDGCLKLADFGLARALNVPLRSYTAEVVTLWYRPPELLLGVKQYATNVDLWSVGCIFAEICNLVPLFQGDCEIGQIFVIFQTLGTPQRNEQGSLMHLPEFNSQFPKWKGKEMKQIIPRLKNNFEALKLLKGLLKYAPKERLTADEALTSGYFNTEQSLGTGFGPISTTEDKENAPVKNTNR